MTKLNTYLFMITFSIFGLAGCGDAAPGNDTAATDKATAKVEVAAPAIEAAPKPTESVTPATETAPDQISTAGKPKIIDFGSKNCKACKAMEPVLESLGANHADKFTTEFVDVWVPENQKLAMAHEISSIPTQVFFAADGKEVFRNTGFISEEDVLAKWAELGLLSNPTASTSAAEKTVTTDTVTPEQTIASATVSGEQ